MTAEIERICAVMDASGYRYEPLAFDDASTDETLARLYEAVVEDGLPQLPREVAGRAPKAPPTAGSGRRTPTLPPA